MARIEARNRFWTDNPPLPLSAFAIAMWLGAMKAPMPRAVHQGTLEDLRADFPHGIKAEHLTG